ncbi:ankyrin repeat domain-containing protein [Paenibacillus allorhizosphaerae]|uniref:Ankyrin repeat domain-containing protein n=1 Tax=Paenibacillus allorhizosphaerae TaxID=2849866 RepID=A0ABN7TJ34_9BACL|nr:ankyrin repeat domain-containing protein [Paenibacillus allorhizosphaerae]CAG7635923.1 hypothetical protein PAECIP111802_02196 [Paenibacillus allorhizosphaerae]
MSKKTKKSVVISVRLDETTLAAVDLLVHAGVAQSRSEAASQFIAIGVQNSEALLLKAKALEENVRKLKNEMLDAVKSKNLEKVKQLLAMDATLKNAASEDGQTAVLTAAYYRANEIKELLLRSGAELNVFEAAAIGNKARVQEIAEESPWLINSHSFDGYTPLGLAAHFGHEETAAYLLDAGADIDLRSRDGKLNNMPLHASIAGNHPLLTKLLLERGADPDSRCEGEVRRGFTPLHVAAHFNRLEAAKLLLEHGADPFLRNSDALTAAEYAHAKGNTEFTEVMASCVRSGHSAETQEPGAEAP